MTTQARKKRLMKKKFAAATTTNLFSAVGVAAAAGTAYFFRRELMKIVGYQPIHVAPHIRAHLPIAKGLPTIADMDGNYDMDGVSFDSEGVVVGSDHQSHAHVQTHEL